MLTIKLTDEQLEQFGISTSEEALSLMAQRAKSPEAKHDSDAGNDRLIKLESAIAAELAAMGTKVAAFNTRFDTVIEDAKAAAKIVAAQEVSAAIAKSGSGSLSKQEMKPDENPGPSKPGADDFIGQFKADKNIQAEFITERAYVLFMEAHNQGRITINKPRSS